MDLSWAAELFYQNISTFWVIKLLQGCKSVKVLLCFSHSYLESGGTVEVPASRVWKCWKMLSARVNWKRRFRQAKSNDNQKSGFELLTCCLSPFRSRRSGLQHYFARRSHRWQRPHLCQKHSASRCCHPWRSIKSWRPSAGGGGGTCVQFKLCFMSLCFGPNLLHIMIC